MVYWQLSNYLAGIIQLPRLGLGRGNAIQRNRSVTSKGCDYSAEVTQ